MFCWRALIANDWIWAIFTQKVVLTAVLVVQVVLTIMVIGLAQKWKFTHVLNSGMIQDPLVSPLTEMCPTCGIGKLESKVQKADHILESYSCGHSRRIFSRTIVEVVNVSNEMLGEEHKLPSQKPLVFAKSDLFAGKISGLHSQDLSDYHETTRFRLLNAEYSLKLILENYNNSVEFARSFVG